MKNEQQKVKEIDAGLNCLETNLSEQLKEIWDKVKLLSKLVSDYFEGRYRGKFTYGSIIEIVAALVYLLMPMDVIFDGIPLVGFSDDLIVLTKVLDSILQELDEYKNWRDSQ